MKTLIKFMFLILGTIFINHNISFCQLITAGKTNIILSSDQVLSKVTLRCSFLKTANDSKIINNGNIIVTDNIDLSNNSKIINGTSNFASLLQVKKGNFTLNDDSKIENDGNIELGDSLGIGGNWVNNSNYYEVFENINGSGYVIFSGTDNKIDNPQKISGKPSYFENVTLTNSGWKSIDESASGSMVKGRLDINSQLDLAANTLIIDNRNNDAISYFGGYILSDPKDMSYYQQNFSKYGKIQWNIGDNAGIFSVPFGSYSENVNSDNSEAKNNLNIELTIKTPGQPYEGKIIFGTYPADMLNNPLPDGVKDLNNIQPQYITDRYWMVDPQYSTKPTSTIKFAFGTNDVKTENNPGMKPENLMAIRYNDNTSNWLDMPANGKSSDNTVTTTDISSQDFFKYWTLIIASKLTIPNVFVPGSDSLGYFLLTKDPITGQYKPEGKVQGIYELHGKIYNRWGLLIYEWDNDNWWNGTYKGKDVDEGTYFYVINAKGVDNKDYSKNTDALLVKGSVTVLRKY